MYRPSLVFCALVITLSCFFLSSTLAVRLSPKGQLIVFMQEGTASTLRLQQESLPALRALAEQYEVDLVLHDVNTQGVPREVSITPVIWFQNVLGRSQYTGRYTNLSRIQNFVRTSRRVAQQTAPDERTSLLIWEEARCRVAVPVKITTPVGDLPAGFQVDAFRQEAMGYITNSMKRLNQCSRVNLQRDHRSFYFDFYPYCDAEGNWYVTTALYSQFSCVTPIYQDASPLSGSMEVAFTEAAQRLEVALFQQMLASEQGDNFEVVPEAVPVMSWEQLGYLLPNPETAGDFVQEQLPDLPIGWQVAGPVDDLTPMIQFHFKAPLEGYNGELATVSGSLQLGQQAELRSATGSFEVATQSLTMGEPTLDEKVHKKYLKTRKHKVATFKLMQVDCPEGPLRYGEVMLAQVQGRFTLMGKEIDVLANAQVEPLLSEQGQPQLQLSASFELPLWEQYGVAGPVGPSPARDEMMIYINLLLTDKDTKS